MKTIIDYVENIMDDFITKEFCVIDGLVLSQLSYVYLEKMVPSLDQDSPSIRIGELLKAENFPNMFNGLYSPSNNKKLLFAMAASPRFRNIKVSYYTNKVDYEEEKQFSAVTFFLCDQTVFVAYRGTDMTLLGWKEDFNMAFKNPVPSQEEGVAYLNAIGEKTTQRLRIGGHSKGGNIAVYSAMECIPTIQDRIINVYSYDGPGFKDSIFEKPEFQRIKNKIIKILPRSSIVGMLLQNQESYKVVDSSQWGIIQHDPFSWIIENGDFRYVESVSNSSLNMNKAINQWVSNLVDKERERFVDALYHTIESTNIKSINKLTDLQVNEFALILKTFRKIDPETRKFLSKTIRELIVLYVGSFNSRS